MENTIHKQEKLNKKGQLFLPDIKGLFVLILVIAVGVITLFIALEVLSDEDVIARTTVDRGDVIRNETITLNTTAQTPVSLRNLTGCAFTGSWPEIYNQTGTTSVSSGNYTVSGCAITIASGASAGWNGANITVVNVSGYYRYTRTSDAVIITSNVTTGGAQFFEQAPSLFTILGVVIIIGAIVVIIFAVNRFSQGSNAL